MDEPQKITYKKTAWFEGAGELIQRSEMGSVDNINWIENQIRSGLLLLYRVEDEAGKMVGIFTAFVDVLYNGDRELVTIHAVTVNPVKYSFINALIPVIDQLAKTSGFDRWRSHSKRIGMSKILAKHGFQIDEIVFSKKV